MLDLMKKENFKRKRRAFKTEKELLDVETILIKDLNVSKNNLKITKSN